MVHKQVAGLALDAGQGNALLPAVHLRRTRLYHLDVITHAQHKGLLVVTSEPLAQLLILLLPHADEARLDLRHRVQLLRLHIIILCIIRIHAINRLLDLPTKHFAEVHRDGLLRPGQNGRVFLN